MGIRKQWSAFFDFGKDCLSAAIDKVTGVILVQIGNATDSTADSDAAELWGPPGYYGIPAAPTQGQPSCQAINLKDTNHDVIVATRDTRDSSIYGNLKAGERCIANGFPNQGSLLIKSDGSVSIATTDDNTATGNSVFTRVSPVEHRFFSPWGSELHDQTGWHLRTWHGTKIDAGGLGLPSALSSLGLQSYVTVTADIIHLDAAMLSLGRNTGGTSSPVVQAVPLATTLALVATALTDIAVAMDGVATLLGTFTGTGGFSGLPAFAALTAAVDAAVVSANTALGLVSEAAPVGTATKTSIA